ncbi:tetratricopeptide repeat protein [Streptomyces sp. NPDC013953]|uniref:tetratricopeptide repeat protein n=1 Tax=Streptomyces sp. NPDC013953 TaxID=3364868 RepID=UPI0037006D85
MADQQRNRTRESTSTQLLASVLSNQQIDPAHVLTPTQLLAAVLVLLVVSVPAFIAGAATTTSPGWVPAMFAVAAVLDVPLALFFVYRLLTKHRQQITSDAVYERAVLQVPHASRDLDESLTQAGVDTEGLVTGTATADQQVRTALEQLEAVMSILRDRAAEGAVPPDVELNLARALMAERRWAEAAEHFDRYVSQVDADWEVHHVRGVAHANTRGGPPSDLSAWRACNEAIALLPDDADPNITARLFAYRGAMAKRLGRYDQAEADLQLARRHATANYEITDIAYNLASVYALAGRRDEAISELRTLRDRGGISLVHGHLDDYFSTLRQDPEFRQITQT